MGVNKSLCKPLQRMTDVARNVGHQMVVRQRHQRLRLREDKGFTLPEAVIAASIITVLSLACAVVAVNVNSLARTALSSNDNTLGVRNATDTITRTIRVATIPQGKPSAFVSAGRHHVEFYASLARDYTTPDVPTLVRYDYHEPSGCLQETTTAGQGSPGDFEWPIYREQVRCVTQMVAPPEFSYYVKPLTLNGGGGFNPPMRLPAQGLMPRSPTGEPACLVVDSSNVSCIVTVGVDLSVGGQVARADASGLGVTMHVFLPNVKAMTNYGEGGS